MNGWEKAGAEILVEIFILAHVVDGLPLLICHLLLDGLSSQLLLTERLSSKLQKHIRCVKDTIPMAIQTYKKNTKKKKHGQNKRTTFMSC